MLVLQPAAEESQEFANNINNLDGLHGALLAVDDLRVHASHTIPNGLSEVPTEILDDVLLEVVAVDDGAGMQVGLPVLLPAILILPIDAVAERRYLLVEHRQQVNVVIEYESLHLPNVRATVWVHYSALIIFLLFPHIFQKSYKLHTPP